MTAENESPVGADKTLAVLDMGIQLHTLILPLLVLLSPVFHLSSHHFSGTPTIPAACSAGLKFRILTSYMQLADK